MSSTTLGVLDFRSRSRSSCADRDGEGNAGALPGRRLVIGLALFTAASALGGAIELFVWRHGNRFVSAELIEYTPFDSFLIPSLLLGVVIAGTSLVAAVLAWRRSRAAIDAIGLAGGTLTVWILAEAAMMREVHWLHLLYGGVGLAILALGVRAGWRSGRARHRWMIAVTGAEGLGFLAPASAGILVTHAGAGPAIQAAALIAAGLVEGLALGAGQAWAFPLPVRRRRYALLTAAGAGFVWATVMAMMALGRLDLPVAATAAAGVAAGLAGLVAIGGAQWLELRRHAARAGGWIGWTALAWALALPLSFAPGPFVDEGTPLGVHFVLWGCGGLLMAYVMALVTWQGARRLAGER